MLIQCTKKLLDHLKITPVESVAAEEPLFAWHANLITLNRKKTVVVVNDLNRYVIVLYDLKAKDLKKIDELIVQGIHETLCAEGICEEVIEKYLLHSSDIHFTRTKDRTSVARMNKACETVEFYSVDLDPGTIFNTKLSRNVSRLMVGDGKNRYIYPNEEMYKQLEEFSGQKIFHSQAIQLKVTLNLEDQPVWRRMVIPTFKTFPELHETLQIAFGWENSHLHEFTLMKEWDSSYHPVLVLVCHEEAFHYPRKIDMKLETDIKLSDYLPGYKRLDYLYDFGDCWEHVIEVEKTIEDYDAPYPIIYEGEGNAPPEDVGGSGGYSEFLKIITNPGHPEYESMLHWGRMQGYEKLNIDQLNRFLRKV